MSYIDKQFKDSDEIKDESINSKSKLKLFALIGVFVFTLAVFVVVFFLVKNNKNTFKIIQDSNVAGEEVSTVVKKRGDEVTITAKEIDGYRFIGWKVGNENISNSRVYTFIANDSIPTKYTAVYEKGYNIEVDVRITNGSVTVDRDIAIGNEEVTITVTPDEFCRLKTLKCKKNTTEIEIIDNKFTMPAGDVFITAEFEKINFLVTVPQEQVGYLLTNIDGTVFNTTTIKANEDIFFKVQVAPEYSKSEIIVKNNQTKLTADNNGVYAIENITDNVNISVEGIEGINIYSVKFPSQVGYTLRNLDDTEFVTASVEYGTTLLFKLLLDESYSQSMGNVIVKYNGIILNEIEGIYTIPCITEDIEITVEGVTINTYSISFPQIQEHYTLKNLDDTVFDTIAVKYGDTITFVVSIDSPYSKSEVVVMNNNIELVAVEGVYTISNITEDVNITVDGITNINQYSVVFPNNQEHYIIKNTDDTNFDTTCVEYGDTITFKIEITEPAYSKSEVVVKNNNVEIISVEGVYTISNIAEDVNITVDGIQKSVYSVTFPNDQIGYTITNLDNTQFETTVAEYGDTIAFKVVVDVGYMQSVDSLVVKNNEVVLTAVEGIYTIEDIKSNLVITVEGLEINVYTITFPIQVTVTRNNTQLESGDAVYHYDIITLSSSPTVGYQAVYTITGALLVENQVNTYKVTDNVSIEYSEEEYIGTSNDYPTLNFTNYDDNGFVVRVGANLSNLPTGNLIIPSKIIRDNKIYSVTITYSNSFKDCIGLTSVVIPSTMKEIWSYSFSGCSNLQTIKFNNCTQLTLLGNYCFKDCINLTSITIPASVIEVGQVKDVVDCRGKIFDGCENLITLDFEDNAQYASLDVFQNNTQLKNVTIPAGVGSIDETFKNNTTIESIKIQAGITNIDNSAFQNCTKLTTVILDNIDVYNNATSTSVLGYLLNNAATVKVLASIVDDVNNTNTYLNNTSNFAKSAKTIVNEKEYYIYTKVSL